MGKPRLPKENGAWLVKNSWGSVMVMTDIFGCPMRIHRCHDTMLVFDFEKADNYDHIYQYDVVQQVFDMRRVTKITAAAVYTKYRKPND